MNAILKSTCNLCILQVSQGLSDLGNKIIRNRAWCILDISVNCLSSIQAEFRNLYDILQGESKILNWKQTKNWLWLWKKLYYVKFKSNSQM